MSEPDRQRTSALRILLESSHPAHVHFFTAIGRELEGRGHHVLLALRDKDVSYALAAGSGLRTAQPRRRESGASHSTALASGRELVDRVRWLRRTIRDGAFDLVVTRNPSGVIAARIARRPSIFDTDDGAAAGRHLMLARPFASIITTPELLPDDLGPRQRRYPGLKTTAFLHPDRFEPDSSVLGRYGLDGSTPLVLARFSANDASHDSGVRSVPEQLVQEIVTLLEGTADLVLSREGRGTSLLRSRPIGGAPTSVRPEDFLHLLAHAQLFVGDSGSVTMEAASLGVPTLRIADTRRRIISAIEARYGLVQDHELSEAPSFLVRLQQFIESPAEFRARAKAGHERLSAETIDVANWFADRCEELTGYQ